MSPLKMFEYLASGRLVLASDLPVLREVLHDGNSILCPPDDVDAWEHVLRRAASDNEWRCRLGERGREDAKHYAWRERVRRIMKAVGE
jgi:glycosyltransferase involved in cell wall biosynthesis